MRSRAAYPPPRLTWNRHQYDPRLKKKAQWISPLKITKISTKIDPKWRVWGTILGGRGLHFGVIVGVWAGSGSQMRLGRRLGRLLGDFQSQDGSNLGPKKVPSWSQNDVKIDEKIDQKSMALEIDFWRDVGGFWEGFWYQNRRRNRCYLRKAVFWKNIVFPLEKHAFLTSRGSKLGVKSDEKSM